MFTPLCKFFFRLQQRPAWTLAAALCATLLALFPLQDFRVHAAGSDLLPREWPSVKAWKNFGRKFGSAGRLTVVVHSSKPKANLAVIEGLARALSSDPQVNFLEYRTAAEFYRSHPLLYISLADLREVERRVQTGFWINRSKRNPLIVDLLTPEQKQSAFDATSFGDLEAKYFSRLKDLLGSTDSTTLILRIYPSFDATDIHACRAFLRTVQSRADAIAADSGRGVEILYTGEVMHNIENEGRLFTRAIQTTREALLLSGALLLVIFFRFPIGALLALLPVGMAVVWTLALTQLWIGPLGIISAPLGLLLVGLGFCGVIHLLSRYAEERRKRLSAPVAFETIILETGPAIAAGLLTLALAFLAFLGTDFRVMGKFGLMAGIGMLCTLVALLAVFPSLLRLVEPAGLLHPFGRRLYNFSGASPVSFARPGLGLLAAAAVTAALLGHGPQFRFQYDFHALGFPAANQRADSLIAASGEAQETPAVFLASNHADAQAIAEVLRKRKIEDGRTTAIGEVATLADLLPTDQAEKIRIASHLRRSITPRVIAEAREPLHANLVTLTQNWPTRPLGVDDLPLEYRKKFLGREHTPGVFTYVFPAIDSAEGVNSLRFAAEVRSITLPDGRTYYAGGWPVVYGDLVSHMLPDLRRALLLGVLAIFAVLLLTVRSARGALTLLLPVLTTALWLLGAMKWMHLKLNPFNVIAFPVAMAYATIHSLHLYHRYEEEGRGALRFVLKRTGGTALIATAIGATGFVPMSFFGHRGMASLGVCTVAGLGFSLISTLLIVPSVFGIWESKRRRREALRALPGQN